ncbi:hypothetical protein [Nostoc sp.]|uniref:hypothetical protein n=1 Tax=Nostoc sp. TaxID=1180 RepID=UPI002FF5EA9A
MIQNPSLRAKRSVTKQIHREPVSNAEIHENVVDQVYQQSVPNLINSLIRRSLLEKTDGLFFLQQIVMEYVTERFIL